MNGKKMVDSNNKKSRGGPFTIYSAGGLFTQDELGANVMIKEAVWRLSDGRFQIILPQSREIQELDHPNIEAFIRNTDLLEMVRADILMARFDGLELDSGTVVEYMMAKFLGKPTVILRTDFRNVAFLPETGPFNSMVKNWPRNVDVYLHSYMMWAELFAKACQDLSSAQEVMVAELKTLQQSADKVAEEVITALEEVIKMESPYPPEYQEMVYRAARLSVGSGFDELLTGKDDLDEILDTLQKNGTL